jgi:hypothetical protein
MRLKKITKTFRAGVEVGDLIEVIIVEFATAGQLIALSLDLPDGFDEWSRAEKIVWGKAEVTQHLASNSYAPSGTVIYPDLSAGEDASAAIESTPGWAGWTAAEAEGWIEQNVSNLASAKTALKAMARLIVHLRDITVER